MICFPLDNTTYDAEDMGAYLATRTRGVFSADGNLSVTADGTGMSVSVSAGLAWLKRAATWGVAALLEQAQALTLDAADGTLSRIDAIVLRLNITTNIAELVIKKGACAATPTVVAPVRNSNLDELYLATVSVAAGTVAVTQAMVTDQRLNEDWCGLMRDGVTGIPTATLQAQAEELIAALEAALDGVLDRTALMLKSVYDTDNDGKVDAAEAADTAADADKLGGQLPAYYGNADDVAAAAQAAAAAMPTAGGSFTGAAYGDGANRAAAELRNCAVYDSTGATLQSTGVLQFWRK